MIKTMRCVKDYGGNIKSGRIYDVDIDDDPAAWMAFIKTGRNGSTGINVNKLDEYFYEVGDMYDYVNPPHYKSGDKEVWEHMIEVYGKEKFIAFCELNVFKYSMRIGKKPNSPVEDDLGKIKWYAEKLKQLRDEQR